MSALSESKVHFIIFSLGPDVRLGLLFIDRLYNNRLCLYIFSVSDE
jgi:hypothetical protein